MVKKLWNLLKIILGVMVICSAFYGGFTYFNRNLRTPGVEYNDSFHNMPADSVDIVVLGSSHAQYSFIPSLAYQNTGLYSYVLGSACQPLEVSYEMLQEALKTQSPELVVLEMYTATPLRSWCEADSCYVIAEYQMRGEQKQNVIDYLPAEKAEQYRNEFMVNHNNWKEMTSFGDLFKSPDTQTITPTFGYVEQYAQLPTANWWYPNVFAPELDEEVKLDELDLLSLNRIYELCQKKGIELMLYMMPMELLDVLNQSYRHAVWDWAKERNVKYVDLVDEAEALDYRLCIHNDGAHSLLNGSAFVTDYLCEFIGANYEFVSHKSDELLDGLYRTYIDDYTLSTLKSEYNPVKYLRRLRNYPGAVLIRYDGSRYNFNETVRQFLVSFGFEDFSADEPLYAVLKNGEIVAMSKTGLEMELDGKAISIDPWQIRVDGEVMEGQSYLGLVAFNEQYDDHWAMHPVFEPYLWDLNYNYDYVAK